MPTEYILEEQENARRLLSSILAAVSRDTARVEKDLRAIADFGPINAESRHHIWSAANALVAALAALDSALVGVSLDSVGVDARLPRPRE